MRILVTGAAGSGQTTLARELARQLGAMVLDSDDFFHVATDPPYLQQRSKTERYELLMAAMKGDADLVLAGSVVDWGEKLESAFDFIVFLYVPTEIRMQRLRDREIARFGKIDPEFELWAAHYDQPTTEGRNLRLHEDWLRTRSCPYLKIIGADAVSLNVQRVIQELRRRFGVRSTS